MCSNLKSNMKWKLVDSLLRKTVIIVFSVLWFCCGQREPGLPLSSDSFRQYSRALAPATPIKDPSTDVFIVHFGRNSTRFYQVREAKRLVSDADFSFGRPTVLYAHGYIELIQDDSVQHIVRSYQTNGRYNILLVDWRKYAFDNYLLSAINLKLVGDEIGQAFYKLIKKGLDIKTLHLVGHSMGAHLLGYTCRKLSKLGANVTRLSVIDAAYPIFYPPLQLVTPLSIADADFVDVIHTDGGGYGAPNKIGHADFWPNEGRGKQPGCLSRTIVFTTEDFCSHWRSWEFWAESVAGGKFLARACDSYDSFLRGRCRDSPLVYMGLQAEPQLRGNFYLRTAAKRPFSLGEKGAE